MRLIALYLVTLIVYFISFSVLSYLTDKEAFEEQEDDELSVVSSELKYFIFFLLLYCVGILSYVLLPALGKGEFLTAAGAGLIYSIITNTGSYLFNFKWIKIFGIRQCLTSISLSIIATMISTTTSYCFAVLVLA